MIVSLVITLVAIVFVYKIVRRIYKMMKKVAELAMDNKKQENNDKKGEIEENFNDDKDAKLYKIPGQKIGNGPVITSADRDIDNHGGECAQSNHKKRDIVISNVVNDGDETHFMNSTNLQDILQDNRNKENNDNECRKSNDFKVVIAIVNVKRDSAKDGDLYEDPAEKAEIGKEEITTKGQESDLEGVSDNLEDSYNGKIMKQHIGELHAGENINIEGNEAPFTDTTKIEDNNTIRN